MVWAECGMVSGAMLWGRTFVIDRNVGALIATSALLGGVMVEQPAQSCLDQSCAHPCYTTAQQEFRYAIY